MLKFIMYKYESVCVWRGDEYLSICCIVVLLEYSNSNVYCFCKEICV